MQVTALEVIDTAVKIGLGGVITVAGTLVITKLNHKHGNGKERAKRYFDALESVGENVEDITHTALRYYWALVIEWVRNNKQGMALTERRQEELDKTKLDLFDHFKSLTVAESKLLLLGLDKPSLLLREYGDFLKEMRRKHYDGKSSLTEEQMETARKELLTKRQALFSALSDSYKNGF
ncbi:hypothetical protein ACEUDB_02820 [Aeromonas hydrophila]|uniref:hypothetical protein n=1 Tax=Aeromonas hydrophila TaxID=644 RepID=UPI0038CF3B6A